MRVLFRSPSPRWPFWLLLVAWGCANSPQVALYTVLTWAAEARTFSHQQRLTADVAHVLAGERAPGILAQAQAELPVRPPQPAIPAEAVLKKFPLSVERVAELLPPVLRAGWPRAPVFVFADTLRAPPPHGPPRAGRV
ncbi:hypothetical protein [Horticoccus sp. 23ND18S-11]|uniref:hypothetical protein n=1 Tax=Horticoccus sp. 23ND18S-11 TaxID=3391832 RepID=UPI0039C96A71